MESTLDYFAQADDGTVYYFGERVDNIRDGKVVDHKGTWLYGRDTDVLGVAMLPNPKVGEQYRFEDVPGITTESNRIEETGLRVKSGRRLHTDVLRTSEFIQPEGELEHKLYAPGVGTIVEYDPDGDRSSSAAADALACGAFMRVAAVGHVEWMEFAEVERVPRPARSCTRSTTFTLPAGGAAVTAVQLARARRRATACSSPRSATTSSATAPRRGSRSSA